MFWFHVYLSGVYKGTFYASDSEEAVKECMHRNKVDSCSIALVTWLVDNKQHSKEYLECRLFSDVHLSYKGE